MKLLIVLLSMTVALQAFCQVVSIKSYRQLLAEDNAGLFDRKPGVLDDRQSAIQSNGYWSVCFSIVNHVGFPDSDTGVKGFRLGLLSSENHSVYGIDIAGLFAVDQYNGGGLQLSSAYNYVGDEMSGLQLACVNYADTLSGLQLGIANAITHGTGCQIGIVNFANAFRGVQIGLVNFNESAACTCLPIINLSF